METIIREVRSRGELERFVSFPFSLYAGNPYWIPPLISDEMATLTAGKNPAFENCSAVCWLAYREGEVVGRVAGIINEMFAARWGKKYARFGWLDFVDDENVSKALMETVETWAAAKQMTAIHGPLGFSDFDPEGMLVEGFDTIGTMTTLYNYPYYATHLAGLQYYKDADWIEYEITVPDRIPVRFERLTMAVARKYNLHLLKARRAKDFLPYANGVFNLINRAYGELYGVVPLTNRQIVAYTRQYFPFMRPEYVSLILRNNAVVAFAITIPSLSRALQKARGRLWPSGFFHIWKALLKNDIADLYLIAVDPELQEKGVTAILIQDLCQKYIKNRIGTAITHPMLEQNTRVLAMWKDFDKRLIKRRRCYIKSLEKSAE